MNAAARRRPWLAAITVWGLTLTLVAVAVPSQARNGPPHAASHGHEVWMLDQGTDLIHVHDARDHREVATVDVSFAALQAAGFQRGNPDPDTPTTPHMIEFDSRSRYAFVAATSGASTVVIDARLKQVAAVLPTGAGSHMAAVTPDDSAVWTAALGAQEMVEILLDLDASDPTFAVGRVLSVPDLLAPVEEANPDWRPFPVPEPDPGSFTYASYAPVCHQYSPDSTEAWITLGPGWTHGGLFVLDLDEGQVTAAWDPAEVHANCGISVSGDRAVANWSGAVVPGADTPGEWYVFDRPSKELLQTHSAARGDVAGLDAHGLRLTPDGGRYWQVNRASNDALVIEASSIDEDTFTAHELPEVADAPDIIDFAPDGSLVYVSQRGPNPRSGAPHAATGTTPGVRVLDAETFETVGLIEPPTALDADGEVTNDVHGVGVRPTGPGEHGDEECPVDAPDADFADQDDIPAVHVGNVNCAAAMDIVRGFADGEFKPRLPVTRAQMASYIFRTLRAAEVDLPRAGERFSDVGEGSEHDEAIHRLAAAGIVEGGPVGMDPESYGPQLRTRRDQMASFLMRAAGFALEGDPDFYEDGSDDGDPRFPDVPSTNVHFGNVDAAGDAGIARGLAGGTYRPAATTSRDQLSSFVVRLLTVLNG